LRWRRGAWALQFNRVIDGRCGHGKYARSLFALPSNASYSAANQ
jgi:hypothetical protein